MRRFDRKYPQRDRRDMSLVKSDSSRMPSGQRIFKWWLLGTLRDKTQVMPVELVDGDFVSYPEYAVVRDTPRFGLLVGEFEVEGDGLTVTVSDENKAKMIRYGN